MIDHYNAFISYKHGPLDSKIAARVQRKLEHFTVPSKIAKQCGKKRIERVFRDKDELPITSDLSETISHALSHSDYLIVICSPETKKSVWVQREIEFFLQTHTRKDVLTVLADGDPAEVIPEILLKDEKSVTDIDGVEHKVEVNLEPLSCDYTIPLKKADKIEIPRLAAALLGCSYDELMDRNRQYRMRRMALVFALVMSIMIAFGSYLVNSRRQIRESYNDSLKSRSRYLATESKNLNAKQKRLDAIRLALAALPEDGEYEVLPEVLRALNDATLAYHSLEGNSIESSWNYYMPNAIIDFTVNDDRTRFAMADESNMVIMWDTESHDEVIRESFGNPILGLKFMEEDKLVVWTRSQVVAYDVDDGSESWEFSEAGCVFSDKNGVSSDSETLFLFDENNGNLCAIDTDSGESIGSVYIGDVTDGPSSYVTNIGISPDERSFFLMVCEIGEGNFLYVYDIETGACRPYDHVFTNAIDSTWIDADSLVVADESQEYSMYNVMGDGFVINEKQMDITCINASDMTDEWVSEMSFSQDDMGSEFICLPAINAIMYCRSNIANSYDMETGELITSYVLNGSVVEVSDVDGDGYPVFITSNGFLLSPISTEPGNGGLLAYPEFPDDLIRCLVGGGIYTYGSTPNEVIYYDVYVYDEEWEETSGNIVLDYIPESAYMYDELLALSSYVRNGDANICLIDPTDNSLIDFLVPVDYAGNIMLPDRFSFLGVYKGKLYMAYGKDLHSYLYVYDIESGETETILLGGYLVGNRETGFLRHENLIFYSENENFELKIMIYDIDSGDISEILMPETNVTFASPMNYIPTENKLLVPTNLGDYIVDLDEGTCELLEKPEEMSTTVLSAVSDSGDYLAITDASKILIYDSDMSVLAEITCNSSSPEDLSILEIDGKTYLTVVYGTGYMLRYDASTGSYLGRTKITVDEGGTYVTYDPDSELIYMQNGLNMNIIETEHWIEIASVPNCLGYNVPTDSFYTFSYVSSSEYNIGRYRRYSLEELIAKAEAILGDSEMSPELRDDYGL